VYAARKSSIGMLAFRLFFLIFLVCAGLQLADLPAYCQRGPWLVDLEKNENETTYGYVHTCIYLYTNICIYIYIYIYI